MVITDGFRGTKKMKEKHHLILYVGINIAKLNYFASAISSDDEVLTQPFQYSNNTDDFHMPVIIREDPHHHGP